MDSTMGQIAAEDSNDVDDTPVGRQHLEPSAIRSVPHLHSLPDPLPNIRGLANR